MAIKGARPEDGRVTPHLMVRGGRKAIAFYTQAFGATVLYESPMPDGQGLHAHLRIGRSMILVTDERPPSSDGMILGVAAPESLGATTTILEYYVENVDVSYRRAVDAGARPILPVGDAFYGDRSGWVMDPFGHIWSISTVKEELSPEQVHARMVAAHG
jgi:PhnB protein